MPDKKEKWEENVKGKYYVDKTCISCDACVSAAGDNFSMDHDQGHAFVKKQPDTPEAEEHCREAMEGCPVEAIGNDGDD